MENENFKMLEIKHVTKVYKTKGGVDTRALDDVSISFGQTGLVFLLGKSGSGKSTLLNVSGGLDEPTSGEIIVKGKSSKDFTGADFDSYRNTFVGFIFQEYNILDEFNVEDNIALALELQGKRKDREKINKLLRDVELEAYAKRKPNTLSGGQKQRIAIARALVKDPQIIMADEPTGALDSATGKQVFDTLKKLSETRLVIVVSHDREFAEIYGDRIVELKDGKIISDVTKAHAAPSSITENVNAIGDGTVRIKDADKLTKAEFDRIYDMIKGKSGEVIITSSQNNIPAVKRACKITDDGSHEYFRDTEPESAGVKSYDGAATKFIKSRLPIGHAIKMGASGLKTKPVRLFFTILISVISFTMFGVLLTMMLYNPIFSISDALKSTGYTTAMLEKTYSAETYNYSIDAEGNRKLESSYTNEMTDRISEAELAAMNNGGNVKFAGVYASRNGGGNSYANYLGSANASPEGDKVEYPVSSFFGFTDCGEKFLTDNNFTKLAGSYPVEANEIAVSNYVYDQFKNRGFRVGSDTVKINDYNDLIGKEISVFDNYGYGKNNAFKITGIYNAGDYLNKYNEVLTGQSSANKESKEYQAKQAECEDEIRNGFYSLAFVSDKFYDEHKSKFSDNNSKYIQSRRMPGVRIRTEKDDYFYEEIREYDDEYYYSEETVKDNAGEFSLYSADGTKINSSQFTIGENDAYIGLRYLANAAQQLSYSSKEYEVFYDKDGNVSYDLRKGWTKENSFWTNYDGEVSFEEKTGYVLVGDGNSVLIGKNGQTASSWDEIYGMYEGCQYYADKDGNLTAERPAEDRLLEEMSGTYFTDGNGNYSTYWQEGWNEENGRYYRLFSDGSIYLEIPDGYFVNKWGYVNIKNPAEIVDNIEQNWRQVWRYYALPNGTLTSISPEGYNSQSYFYYNTKTGELSLKSGEGDDWQGTDGFYVDSRGNATVEYPEGEQNIIRVRGIFINAAGELSLTKKAGYNFYSQWMYNWQENKVSFAKEYDGYYINDTTGKKVCDPAIDYTQSGNGTENVNYTDINKEFNEALKKLSVATGSYYEDEASGELADADVALIISSIKNDWAEWRGDEQSGLPEKVYAINRNRDEKELTVKGFYYLASDKYGDAPVISSSFAASFKVMPSEYYEYVTEYETDYVAPENLKYNSIVAKSDNLSEDVYFMLEDKDNAVSYRMYGNEVYDGAATAISMIETLSLVFLIAGLVLAVLSALLLFNFISTSISAKRKEIGVLRAVGARGTDVFKIFFAESFIITIICFIISAVVAGVLCFVLNGIFAGAISLSILNYGVLEVLLILGVSVVVAVIATVLPVYFASRKKPVESIRAL